MYSNNKKKFCKQSDTSTMQKVDALHKNILKYVHKTVQASQCYIYSY